MGKQLWSLAKFLHLGVCSLKDVQGLLARRLAIHQKNNNNNSEKNFLYPRVQQLASSSSSSLPWMENRFSKLQVNTNSRHKRWFETHWSIKLNGENHISIKTKMRKWMNTLRTLSPFTFSLSVFLLVKFNLKSKLLFYRVNMYLSTVSYVLSEQIDIEIERSFWKVSLYPSLPPPFFSLSLSPSSFCLCPVLCHLLSQPPGPQRTIQRALWHWENSGPSSLGAVSVMVPASEELRNHVNKIKKEIENEKGVVGGWLGV